jgi:transposase
MSYQDRTTGERHAAPVFVTTLGASSATYCEAQPSQALPSWISGHVHAFEYFGGVPEIVVPDNAKTGVASACFYEPDLNPTYQDMALYYGTAVLPTRVRHPRDKAKVETGVQVVERWVIAPLRNRTFFSLEELNAAVGEKREELNLKVMEHLGKSRRELYEALDRPALRPLPERPYEPAEWKRAKVGIDYHVQYQGHYYSVPYDLRHKDLELRATDQTVEVFSRGQRVASHLREATAGYHSTLPDICRPLIGRSWTGRRSGSCAGRRRRARPRPRWFAHCSSPGPIPNKGIARRSGSCAWKHATEKNGWRTPAGGPCSSACTPTAG